MQDYNRDEYSMDDAYEEKRHWRRGFFSGILTVAFIAAAGLLVYTVLNLGSAGFRTAENSGSASVGSSQVEQKTERLKALIDQYYLDDVDESAMVEGMYAGMLNGLGDPYTVYYTEEEFNALMESTSGEYKGIGALMSQNIETGIITITRPFEGCPAQQAGIIAGDIITKVNGQDVGSMELSEVVAMIKGEAGTTVDITVYRDREELDFTVERADIQVPTVNSKMLDDKIGYIYVMEFDEVTADQFHDALEDLKSQGMEQLVIDLRDNPGGSLDTVIQMLDEILPEGLLVYTEDKYGNREESTSDAENYLSLPMTVLVNGNSASASEIFAGAVKDYHWATLVGTTTYGKGIVQRIFDLGDGTAAKITISKYYTPAGNNIHGIGIEPDVEVEIPTEAYDDGVVTEDEDAQLQKALELLRSGQVTAGEVQQ